MRIALIYKDLSLGGVQRKMVDIINTLIERKNTEVYLFLTQQQGEFLDKIPAQVQIVNLDISLRAPHVFILPVKLLIAFTKYKPKVVLAMMDTFGCSAVLARKMMINSKPKIFISQDIHASGFFLKRPWPWFRRMLVRKLYPQADIVISVSKAVTQDLVNNYHLPDEKIVLIRNWVQKPQHKINHSRKIIDVIYAGRFAPEKDLALLLKAFALLVKKRPKSTICLLGYGEEERIIRKIIKKLGISNNVSLPGFTHDVKLHLKKSWIFAMTSYNEGIPMAMLEAMSIGVPVITSDFPGIRELIRHRKSGLIANSEESISYFMYYLLTHKQQAKKIAHSAQKLVEKDYSVKNLQKLVSMLLRYA